ncbi:MAG: anti-sigma factor [Devosia sp.]|nr:anti-sigma factor [Devosia sp.]
MSREGESEAGEGDRVLVAEYALGLLDAGEHAALARRIAAEPALAAELGLWQARLASLDAEFAEVLPPGRTLPAIERRLFGAPAPRSGWWDSLPLWRGLAGAGLVVAMLAVGFNLLQPPRPDPQLLARQLVAALSEQGSDVSVVALFDPATGSLRLTALSGPSVPDRDFELWAIKGSAAPVSMGIIPAMTRSDIRLSPDVLDGFGEGTVLAISLEPRGGSPSGSPTGPIVAKGAATPI